MTGYQLTYMAGLVTPHSCGMRHGRFWSTLRQIAGWS